MTEDQIEEMIDELRAHVLDAVSDTSAITKMEAADILRTVASELCDFADTLED